MTNLTSNLDTSEFEAAREGALPRLILRYGSEQAVLAETSREASLRAALGPIADVGLNDNGYEEVFGFAGWSGGPLTEPVWQALRSAYKIPDNLAGVWSEYLWWTELLRDRVTVDPAYDPPAEIMVRFAALRQLLNTKQEPTTEGLRIRLAWLNAAIGEVPEEASELKGLVATLTGDFEKLAADISHLRAERSSKRKGATQAVAPIHRTTADKQRDVLSILDATPELSDRTIAKRAGVSPSTVGKWRRSKAPAC